MKLKFKQQDYQTQAVKSVTDCFKGQPLRVVSRDSVFKDDSVKINVDQIF